MKKAACTTFVNLLNTIHEKEITTKAALMADPPLYTEFWLALKSFCRLALLSKTSGKNARPPGMSLKLTAPSGSSKSSTLFCVSRWRSKRITAMQSVII